MAMNDTPDRPPHGWRGLLIFDREELAGNTTDPIGRAAESVVPTHRYGLCFCGNGDGRFARHDDRSRHKADSAFALSACATPAVASHEERGRLANSACPICEAALLPQRRENAGAR